MPPVVRFQGKRKDQMTGHYEQGDNSNTHFAILALWAARRHDLPVDDALLATYQRFAKTQYEDGGWGYDNRGTTSSMTCVGLLGLAMGQALAPDLVDPDPKKAKENADKSFRKDPVVQKAFQRLAKYIGDPSDAKQEIMTDDVYFLWSLERVAMLHDVETIGGKDWYGWGLMQILPHQHPLGAWASAVGDGGINAHIKTCFALLFLKRSNLVYDLRETIRLRSGFRPER
jgi:hypothetical protein